MAENKQPTEKQLFELVDTYKNDLFNLLNK